MDVYEVIGIDHGWSYIKTVSDQFVTGVKKMSTEPALKSGLIYLIPLFIGASYAWQAKALLITAACVFATIAAIAECREILGNIE